MICKLANTSEIKSNTWYEYTLETNNGLQSIMLIKKGVEYHGFINSCPHQNRRLDYAQGQFLIEENGNIICPAHGAEFNPDDGSCISGPCKGQSLDSVHIQVSEETIFAVIQ